MLGSCSSSDDLNGGGNNTGFNENGDGFVAVAINLPTTKSTPSRVNDDFKDGTADEYEVKMLNFCFSMVLMKLVQPLCRRILSH